MEINKDNICPHCEGNGYTIEIEGQCCWNTDYIQEYGCCCGIPDPIQVQVPCNCVNGFIPQNTLNPTSKE